MNQINSIILEGKVYGDVDTVDCNTYFKLENQCNNLTTIIDVEYPGFIRGLKEGTRLRVVGSIINVNGDFGIISNHVEVKK